MYIQFSPLSRTLVSLMNSTAAELFMSACQMIDSWRRNDRHFRIPPPPSSTRYTGTRGRPLHCSACDVPNDMRKILVREGVRLWSYEWLKGIYARYGLFVYNFFFTPNFINKQYEILLNLGQPFLADLHLSQWRSSVTKSGGAQIFPQK